MYMGKKLSSYFVVSILVLALLPTLLSSASAQLSALPINPNWHALGFVLTTANNQAIPDIDPLGNDNLPLNPGENPPDTVIIVAGPSHGSAVFDSDSQTVAYTPNNTYAGPDSFTYQDCSALQNVAILELSALP